MTDQELIQQILAGDPGAAERLLRRHMQALRRHAVRRIESSTYRGVLEVDDVLQGFLFKACDQGFRLLASWRGGLENPEASIEPYLKQCLSNFISDEGRRARRRERREVMGDDYDRAVELRAAEVEVLIASRRDRAAMLKCYQSALNSRQREALYRQATGETAEEIGAKIGAQEGAVRTMVHRAIKAVVECIRAALGNADEADFV